MIDCFAQAPFQEQWQTEVVVNGSGSRVSSRSSQRSGSVFKREYDTAGAPEPMPGIVDAELEQQAVRHTSSPKSCCVRDENSCVASCVCSRVQDPAPEQWQMKLVPYASDSHHSARMSQGKEPMPELSPVRLSMDSRANDFTPKAAPFFYDESMVRATL